MTSVAALRKLQIGKETTRGTEVAATSRIIGRPGGITYRDLTEKPPTEADWGLLDERHSTDPSEIARQITEIEVEQDLSFEQILEPLLAGVIGAVTPVTQAMGADGELWTFTPNAATDPVPDAFTMEYSEDNGTADILAVTMTFGLVRRIRISQAQGAEYATLAVDWFARKSVAQAKTAAIGIPVRQLVVGPIGTVGIATSFSGLSSATVLSAQIVNWEWELVTGIMPKFRIDASAPDFSAYGFTKRKATLKLGLDWSAEAETERASRLQAAALQYFRVEMLGPAIGASNFRIHIDGCYELTNPVEAGRDVEGQSQTDLEYTAVHDATKGAAFEVVVQNSLSAIP